MKKICLTLVACWMLLNVCTPASAIPAFKKAFLDHYGSNPELKKVVNDLGCNVCHFGKNEKKNRNDYGRALAEFLHRSEYTGDRMKAEPEKVKKEFDEAFKKVESMKAKDGTPFGERLKAGKAPGTPE
jgi:hypothetical protein